MLLAIDIGTSSAKAIVFDPATARILAVAGQEYPIQRPALDRAEQNPGDWWGAVTQIVGRITSDVDASAITAIGLTGQMHGTLLLDAGHHPLHPAIIWADQRSASVTAEVVSGLGEERFISTTGTMPAAGFMAATLVWLARHEPGLLEKADTVILPKDYVRLKLTGEVATDISDAAATALFDVRNGRWSDVVIGSLGLPDHIFPEVLGSSDVAGTLTHEAASVLGLTPGIPVVAGCADQPAQALANGLIAPGTAAVTTGTGGQVFVPLALDTGDLLPADKRLHVFNHAAPGRWYVLGAILAAGLALRWLRGIVGLKGHPDAYAILSAEAGAVPLGAEGLVFLPYLVGERTPHMDPLARGAFVGLAERHTRGHLARAVMEGVAFALRQTLEISLSVGDPVASIIVAGGGAESDVWRGIQADVFGLPLRRTLQPEQTCVGAALLAGAGTGYYRDLEEAVASAARHGPPTDPDPIRHERYNALYAMFCDLYPHLRDDFHHLTSFSLEE